MELKPLSSQIENIPARDWARAPESVRQVLVQVLERITRLEEENKQLRDDLSAAGSKIAELEEENRELRERLGQNSSNSSKPPSSDGPERPRPTKKKPTGKRRGGQKGHPGYSRELIPVEECQVVKDHYPTQCGKCGHRLKGKDPAPYRHQVVELPPVKPYVEEHRLHQLACEKCGGLTRAKLPDEVPISGYGARVVAIAAILSGLYRMSERMLQTAFKDLFGIEMALGTVNSLRQEASQAVAQPVEQACEYVKKQPVINSDETGFTQGNADGFNPARQKAWLWVAVTEYVTVFRVMLSRGQEAAQLLLGVVFTAILITDRWNGYNWVKLSLRQLCWAHLKRDFTKISEREGDSGRIGKRLLEEEELLFRYWYRVRDGTLKRSSFKIYAAQIRSRIKALLEEGAAYEPEPKEKSARAKTARTCRELLKLEPAMWLFVRREGIEPTNNAAEQALRPVVLWRKNSFGTQSAEGSMFVARIMTVVMTLRSQQRGLLDYMVEACQAYRNGRPAPSLLPVYRTAQAQIPCAA